MNEHFEPRVNAVMVSGVDSIQCLMFGCYNYNFETKNRWNPTRQYQSICFWFIHDTIHPLIAKMKYSNSIYGATKNG